MQKPATALFITLGLLGTAAPAMAQYTGPTTGERAAAPAAGSGYTGPTSVPTMTVKQLLDTATDDQHVRLQGRIVSHDGGKNYTFADDSGRMPVEISDKRFPAGQPISAQQRVELVGEVDKGIRKMEFEVEQVRLIP
ncbi:NirD/YgiW/YdeI family stress tolerance protein [Acidovorax sp. SUPP1855]|uniref:YgiW/YdeI family stress tolerance OB fold protein n=1 Tax=Acidovorax sp. SUPP1855 TaxID=431774 RepID=UPI0023DE2A20|nr:NirD/YgiW/YdeI family stress tolerance protein [Acidovorax sp. SUPP1855]GKS87409.1 NirD/YgiW/YdeI family stress tolerance protein [Acidovorax sp. SUPP1855]